MYISNLKGLKNTNDTIHKLLLLFVIIIVFSVENSSTFVICLTKTLNNVSQADLIPSVDRCILNEFVNI